MTLTMPVSGDMQVEVYNLLGQVVATLASGYKNAGTHNLTWDATDAASGVYFIALTTSDMKLNRKVLLLK